MTGDPASPSRATRADALPEPQDASRPSVTPAIAVRRYVLTKTPWEIGVLVAHQKLRYGTILEDQPDILVPLKKAIFAAIRDTIDELAEYGIEERHRADLYFEHKTIIALNGRINNYAHEIDALIEALKLAVASYEDPAIWLDDARTALAQGIEARRAETSVAQAPSIDESPVGNADAPASSIDSPAPTDRSTPR